MIASYDAKQRITGSRARRMLEETLHRVYTALFEIEGVEQSRDCRPVKAKPPEPPGLDVQHLEVPVCPRGCAP